MYFPILLMEKTKQGMAEWLSPVMTSEGQVKWLELSCSLDWKWGQSWPISTVVVPAISVKASLLEMLLSIFIL